MKKIICVAFLLLITAISTFSQMATLKKIAELRDSGVDSLVVYYPQIYIRYDLTKAGTCQSFNEKYLIWLKGGKTYIQLFDECYTYKPLVNNNLKKVFTLIKEHLNEIGNEQIKPVQYKEIRGGEESIVRSKIDHSNHCYIEFYLQSKVISKTINSYDLSEYVENYFGAGTPPNLLKTPTKEYNINYTYNKNTYISRVKEIIEQRVEGLNFEKQ